MRFAGLFEARRRLSTSATKHDVRARPSSERSSPDEGRNLLPALATALTANHAVRIRRGSVKRPRGASHAHPRDARPVADFPRLRGVSTTIRPPRRLCYASLREVTPTTDGKGRETEQGCHQDPLIRRAARRYIACVAWPACVSFSERLLLRDEQAVGVPLLSYSRTPLVTGAFGDGPGETPSPLDSLRAFARKKTDRSRFSFQDHPAKDELFQRTRVPFTVTRPTAAKITPRGHAVRPPSHAAHTLVF